MTTNRIAWPTVASSDTWTATQFNTYMRDNDLAYWVFNNSGDTVYATSSTTLAARIKGSAGAVRYSTGSVPAWTAKKSTVGMFHDWQTADFSNDQDFKTSWEDVTGSSVTLTLTVTCTVVIIATVTGYNKRATNNLYPFEIRGVIDGVADAANKPYNRSQNPARNEAMGYIYYSSGITSGSRIAKLQSDYNSDWNHITQGRIIAFALVD